MKPFSPVIIWSLAWAALLIGLPLVVRFLGLAPATAGSMTPVLTVLAALHLGSLGSRRCLPRRGQG
ncbi:MAG: hypothetical protein JSS36_05965 [Proteobacteria bacterium]|nr:hypothetical protein [Pseudomonadota bacterium]